MSVTVSDLLELPSLKSAKVLAGREGLSRIVSTITVLEYAEATPLQDTLFQNNEFYGSELVISGLVSVKDDVDAQCANIRRMAEAGEVGLILYYVGIFLPCVDQRLITLADELNFTLISMPENRMDIRYSEVICEAMEAIYKDQAMNTSIVTELLERVSRLPIHQRTVGTVLKMVADRIRTSVMLTDASGRVLNEAAWPRTMGELLVKKLAHIALPPAGGEGIACGEGCLLYRYAVTTDYAQPMNLLLFREGTPLEAGLLRQTLEVVQLAVNIWSRQHDEVAVTELVRAILQDEPMKMRRLADIFHVDVAAIHTMWILHSDDLAAVRLPTPAVEEVRRLTAASGKAAFADVYQSDLLIFFDKPDSISDADALYESLCNAMPLPFVLTQCENLAETSHVRAAFLDNQDYLAAAQRIFPDRLRYSLSEIVFSKDCQKQIEGGETAVQEALAPLGPLHASKGEAELLETLGVYLLDCNASVSRTAQRLFLHKNTVKYRLQRLSDLLGFHVEHMPEAMALYRGTALARLLS